MKNHPLIRHDWTPLKTLARLAGLVGLAAFYLALFQRLRWLITFYLGRTTIPPPQPVYYVFWLGLAVLLNPVADAVLFASSWRSSEATQGFASRRELRRQLKDQTFAPGPVEGFASSADWLLLGGTFIPKNTILGLSATGRDLRLFARPTFYVTLFDGSTVGLTLPSNQQALASRWILEQAGLSDDVEDVGRWAGPRRKELAKAAKTADSAAIFQSPDPLEVRYRYAQWRQTHR